jgi:uncharacterized protein (TIGR02246 family)
MMSSSDETSIRTLLAEYKQVCETGDPAAFAALFTEDAVVMPPNQPIVNSQPAIQRWAEALFGSADVRLDIPDAEIEVAGEWAFVRGVYSITFTPKEGGASIEDCGKWLDVFRRHGNESWKYARAIWNSDQPLPSGT